MQSAIPCLLMRGGTSKGPFFKATDLPADTATRDRVLLAALGSPDKRQIDGIGGAHPLTSKVGIVSVGQRPGIDLDFLFAQHRLDLLVPVHGDPRLGADPVDQVRARIEGRAAMHQVHPLGELGQHQRLLQR